VEVESGRQQEFGSKLAQAMQQLRHDQESQLQQYRDDIDRTFSSKVQTKNLKLWGFFFVFFLNAFIKIRSHFVTPPQVWCLLSIPFDPQLQNAQLAAFEKNNVASATKDELETTKLRVETLNFQLQQYQKDVSSVLLHGITSLLGDRSSTKD